VSVRLPAAMSDIDECADVLLPSIEWERSFLQYFDNLRARVDAARVLVPRPSVLAQGVGVRALRFMDTPCRTLRCSPLVGEQCPPSECFISSRRRAARRGLGKKLCCRSRTARRRGSGLALPHAY